MCVCVCVQGKGGEVGGLAFHLIIPVLNSKVHTEPGEIMWMQRLSCVQMLVCVCVCVRACVCVRQSREQGVC